MLFVAPFPYNGSQAKELGNSAVLGGLGNIKPEVTSTHAPVNGWGGGYYHNGCPHCGYCPTCGRSDGYRPYYPYYYMSTGGSSSGSVCGHIQ